MRHHIDMYPSSFERYCHLIRWFFEFLMLLERNPDGSQLSGNYFHSYRALCWSPLPRERVWTTLHPSCTGKSCGSCRSCCRKHLRISSHEGSQSLLSYSFFLQKLFKKDPTVPHFPWGEYLPQNVQLREVTVV